MKATNLADLYEFPLLDWGRIEARLNEGLSQAPGTGGPNRQGFDLVVEGMARPVTDPATVAARAVQWSAALETVKPGGATRWSFAT